MDRAESGVELGSFLRAMRERLTPEAAGLPGTGTRRTPGLRRQEVAELAAVSIDWYIRLEQGRAVTPGAAVLDAIAAALQLNDSERSHLHLIARGSQPPPQRAQAPLSASMRAILDGMPLLPAYAMDFRGDVLSRNAAAAALFGEDFLPGVNIARLIFLDEPTRATQLDWPKVARETVGDLRLNLARNPEDPRLRDLITELRTASTDFATWWNDHTVQERHHGRKRFQHPTEGTLTLDYDTLVAPDTSAHRLFVLTPANAFTAAALRTLITARAHLLGTHPLHPAAG
ncbi:helix-turn-helix transcriptional regulator [Nocardia sp. NPDC056000]|uniref:helix-turn-helix transcriptional regulator n=1 Tax=Nocardia sp. NPDC056000 TaxID=3345674 RepID=UPI0035D64C98